MVTEKTVMSCCDDSTARVPITDVSRRLPLKGAPLIASVILLAGSAMLTGSLASVGDIRSGKWGSPLHAVGEHNLGAQRA
jgi:hypothetical protein